MTGKWNKNKTKKHLETSLGHAPKEAEKVADLSHLRKPITTSIFGLKQVLSLFQTATDEVQEYITYECDVLYECRICRTIFRSLANFILHKRNFCREKYNYLDGANSESSGGFVIEKGGTKGTDEEPSSKTPSEDGSNGVQKNAEQKKVSDADSPGAMDLNDDQNEALRNTILSTESEVDSKKGSKKTILPIIDKLIKKQEINILAKNTLNEDLSNKSENSDDDVVFVSEESNVMLQKIDTSDAAVFQTSIKDHSEMFKDCGFMKSEVMEIHGIFENNEVVLGSNGKVCNFETNKKTFKPNIPKQDLVCTECNFTFSTEKTLTHHIKYKHNKTCIVYPCPDCKDTFSNAWSVYRHLYKVHRRTSLQVRRMRAQIHSSGIRKGQEPEKKKDKSQMELKENEENQWMNNFEGDKDLQMCGGCGKRFERKAALHSHSQMCIKRIAVCNTIKENNSKTKIAESKTKATDKIEKINDVKVLKGSAKRKPKPMFRHKVLLQPGSNNVEHDVKNDRENDRDIESPDISSKENNLHVVDGIDTSGSNNNKMENESDSSCRHREVEKRLVFKTTNKTATAEHDSFQLSQRSYRDVTDISKIGAIKSKRRNSDLEYNEKRIVSKPSNRRKLPSKYQLSRADCISLEKISEVISDSDDEKENSSVASADKEIIKNCLDGDVTITKHTDTIEADRQFHSLPEIEIFTISDDSNDSDKVENDIETELSKEKLESLNSEKQEVPVDYNDGSKSLKRKRAASWDFDNKAIKITDDFKEYLTDKADHCFFAKALPYIDKNQLKCIPCQTTYLSHYQLLWHMSLHFSWFRFQCSKCSFMSFNEYDCTTHAYVRHGTPNNLMGSTVLPIPKWKVLCASHNFTELSEEDINNSMMKATSIKSDNQNIPKESQKQNTTSDCNKTMPCLEAIHETNTGNKQTNISKTISDFVQMSGNEENQKNENISQSASETIVLEDDEMPDICSENVNSAESVIVPNEETKERIAAKENKSSEKPGPSKIQEGVVNNRPIRNRTKSVKTVQNDFIYDLAKVLKLNDSSIKNSKVKKSISKPVKE